MAVIADKVMAAYGEIASKLGFESFVADFITGKLPSLFLGLNAPPFCWGLPPALIPIWSENDWSSYIGIWKHWFSRRQATFVRFDRHDQMRAIEIARTEAQFARTFLLRRIYVDDDVTPELRKYAERMNVDDVDRLNQMSMDHRKDEEKLAEHPAFKGNLPLLVAEETGLAYSGDFPSELNPTFDMSNASGCCYFDFHPDLRERIRGTQQCPLWLADGARQPELFQKLLARQDFAGAWLCLNSTGWDVKASRNAIRQLADAAADEQFKTLADAWCRLPDTDFFDY